MSTHKNIDRICVVVLVLTLLVTVAFMNGEKLGIRVVADEDAESYSGSTYFTENDVDGDWADNAYTTYITLDGSGGTIDGNGAYFLDGDLVISNGGWYVLTGTLEDGKIIVDAHDSSKVWIRLNGVTVRCSDDACLRVDQADKVFLTLAEDTENSFSSGTDYSEEALADNTGGTIFSHDDLTINGSGSLSITAGYKHGIDVNDSLVITGGNITITAPQDGIHVSDSLRFMEASLTIDAGDDAVHSDDELYIESGTVLINSCYEGFEAVTIDITGGDITMYPTDDGINANGGSSTMGFGGRGGGGTNGMPSPPDFSGRDMSSMSNTLEGGMPSMPGEMPGTTSTDGEMTSGMPSQGEMSSMPGEMSGTTSTDGEMTSGMPSQGEMPSTPGEMPGAAQTENSDTDDTATDEKEPYIRISGGTLTIINATGRDADGLDSNGSIYIDGGDIRISLLGDGTNNAIDYGSESGGECIVTGGTILAFGGSGMAEEFSENCTQCAVLYNIGSTVQAGTLFSVRDQEGEEIISYTPECSYSSVSFSLPEMTVGETYTVVCGEDSSELTMDSTAVSAGTTAGENIGGNAGGHAFGMGGMGGMRRGGMGFQNGSAENGSVENGSAENGSTESGSAKSGNPENSSAESGSTESGNPENGSAESGSTKSGNPENGSAENGSAESGSTESENPESGSVEAGVNETGYEHRTRPAGNQAGGNGFIPEDAADTEDQMTEYGGFTALSEFSSEVWLLLGASVLALIVAILFAKYYRKH